MNTNTAHSDALANSESNETFLSRWAGFERVSYKLKEPFPGGEETDARRPATPPPLEIVHTATNCAPSPSRGRPMLVVRQGGSARIIRPESIDRGKVGEVRGEITGFSSAARRRMLELMGRVDWHRVGRVSMITLTYSGFFDRIPPETVKADMQALRMFLKRMGCRMCLWRKELQKRGAMHYHLLVPEMSLSGEEELRAWWHDRAGHGQDAHEERGMHVLRPKDAGEDAARGYISKYTAKVAEGGEKWIWGRVWGCWFVDTTPWHLLEVFVIQTVEELFRKLDILKDNMENNLKAVLNNDKISEEKRASASAFLKRVEDGQIEVRGVQMNMGLADRLAGGLVRWGVADGKSVTGKAARLAVLNQWEIELDALGECEW